MTTTFDVIGRIGFWNGAAYSDEGDGQPEFPVGDENDPIEAQRNGLLVAVPALVGTKITYVAIGPVLFWNGSAYSIDGSGHPAIDVDSIEDQPRLMVGAMIPLSSNPPTPTPVITPPTVTLVSPAEGQIAANDEVVIDITVPAPATLRLVQLSLAFPVDAANGPRAAEVIYSSSRGVGAMYPGTTVSTIATGVRVTMKRFGGWPARGLRFDPDVVTSAGAENP